MLLRFQSGGSPEPTVSNEVPSHTVEHGPFFSSSSLLLSSRVIQPSMSLKYGPFIKSQVQCAAFPSLRSCLQR